MNVIKSIFSPYKLSKVFTPNTVAKLAYIKRSVLEDDLEKYIQEPGKQIVLYGHSGSGKTSLIRTKLKELNQKYIKTHCESTTTFNDLILQAFDELNRFYIAEKSTNETHSISSASKAEYGVLSAKMTSSISESNETKSFRIVPPQLTSQKLAKFLGEAGCIWIIEDFHKVAEFEKKRIADLIKVFIDSANDFPKVKIICIGAVGTARELLDLDNNLNNRIAQLQVPLLTNEEIAHLVDKGCRFMNIQMAYELKTKIIYYSNNLASIAHQICYDICFHYKIKKTQILTKKLMVDSFKVAVNSFVRKNSDTFNKLFDKIVSIEFGYRILKAFDKLEQETLTYEEIRKGINYNDSNRSNSLKNILERLGSSEFEELIRYDDNSNKYSMSSPFFRAFLKMKLAIENNNKILTDGIKSNKKQKTYKIDERISNKPIKTIILDEEYFLQYYNLLNSFRKDDSELN